MGTMGQMGQPDASTTRWDALTYDGSAPGRNVPSLHVFIRPRRHEGKAPDEARRLFQDIISRYYSGPPFLTPEEKMRDLLVTAVPTNARAQTLQLGIAICNRAESTVHLFRQGGAEAWLGGRPVAETEGRVRFLREASFAFVDGSLDDDAKARLAVTGAGRLVDDGRTAGLSFTLNPGDETAGREEEVATAADRPARLPRFEPDPEPVRGPAPEPDPGPAPEPREPQELPLFDAAPDPDPREPLDGFAGQDPVSNVERETVARSDATVTPNGSAFSSGPAARAEHAIADRIADEVLAPRRTRAERIAFPLLPASLVLLVALVAFFWRQPGRWEEESPPSAVSRDGEITASPGSAADGTVHSSSEAPAGTGAAGVPRDRERGTTGPGDLYWAFRAAAAITSSPAVLDGMILVGSRDGHVYALDPATGDELWKAAGPQGVGSSPAYGGGRVYFADYGGDITAVDLATGAEIWRRGTGSKIVSSPLYDGERVYVGSFNRSLYALSSESGEVVWRYRADDAIWSSPRLAGDLVLIGSIDRHLHAVRREDGRREWKAATGGPIYASATVQGDRIFVGSRDGFFYCLSASDGSRIWRTEIGSAIHSSAALGDDRLFVGTEDGALVSLSLATGELLWSFPTGARLPASPVLHEGVVYAPSYDQYAYALEAESGHPVWRVGVGSSAYSSPAVWRDRLCFGTNDGRLVALAIGESP